MITLTAAAKIIITSISKKGQKPITRAGFSIDGFSISKKLPLIEANKLAADMTLIKENKISDGNGFTLFFLYE